MDMLRKKWAEKKFLCIGLDSDKDSLPPVEWRHGQMAREWQLIFNKKIIDATFHFVCAYKLNFAFYFSEGFNGLWVLEQTIMYVYNQYPDIPIILDGKWGDIGNTTKKYAKAAFDWLGADAVTVNPYMGRDALEPFLQRSDKGIFVLCKTSNPGSDEFQSFGHEFVVHQCSLDSWDQELYKKVAWNVAHEWNENENCGLEVGATSPDKLRSVRKIAPSLPILIPGVGAQGGELESAVRFGCNNEGSGFIINVSRSVIFASRSDFDIGARKEAQKLSRTIQKCLKGERYGEYKKKI